MGNNNVNSFLKKEPLYEKSDVLSQKTVNDIRYGSNVSIIQKRSNQTKYYAAITKTFNDLQIWQARVNEIKFRIQLDHPNLVKLVNYSSEKQDDFCSSFYKVGQLYEYYSNDLRQEIFERRKYNIPYNESEIWYIIDSLVSVASYLKYKEVTHGDIRPYNVFIDQIGQIKLGEQYSHPQTYSLYSQLLMGTTDDFFVSPQCLNGLRAHQEFPDFDRSKNEVFSIGMTALNAATLQDTNKECYDISQLTLNRENVQNLLQRVKFQFSQNLSTTIENMLLHSQEQRASLEEILDITNAQSNKAQSLSIVEVFQNEQPNPYDNNKVIEANNLIVEDIPYNNLQNHKVIDYIQVEQPKVNYITRDFTNDDLMARIQKVLAESDQVINKFGSQNQTIFTTNQYTSNQSQPVSNINNSMITNTAINTNFTPNYVDQQLYRTINITPNIVQENRISQYVSEDNEAVKKSKKSTNIQDYVPISESQNNVVINSYNNQALNTNNSQFVSFANQGISQTTTNNVVQSNKQNMDTNMNEDEKKLYIQKIISDVRAAQQLGNNAQISQV